MIASSPLDAYLIGLAKKFKLTKAYTKESLLILQTRLCAEMDDVVVLTYAQENRVLSLSGVRNGLTLEPFYSLKLPV